MSCPGQAPIQEFANELAAVLAQDGEACAFEIVIVVLSKTCGCAVTIASTPSFARTAAMELMNAASTLEDVDVRPAAKA